MFEKLENINLKPKLYEKYTAYELWTDEYTSKQMLNFHLNEEIDVASRNGNFIKKSVEWISKNFIIDSNTTICDFGCGAGLYTQSFAQKGAKVTGIDFSKSSIEYAKNRAIELKLDIEYILKNYLEFSSNKKFDIITMIMCDFCVLSDKQRKTLLTIFKKHLKDNGVIILDVYSTKSYSEINEKAIYEKNQLNGFWSPNSYYAFVNTYKYDDEKVVLDKYTIIEQNSIKEVYNWFKYYNLDSLKFEIESNGLIISEFYSDVSGNYYNKDSKEIAVVIKKK